MRWFLPLLLLGCGDPADGTSIGNPNLTLLRLAPAGDGITLTTGTLQLQGITLRDFGGQEATPELPAGTNVLDGVELDLPEGDWQSIDLRVEGLIEIRGTDVAGSLELDLSVPVVGVSVQRGAITIDGPHVFELAYPSWLTAEEVGWSNDEPHVVRPGDALHEGLAQTIRDRSAFLPDDDGDGEPER